MSSIIRLDALRNKITCKDKMAVLLETSLGDIVIDLFTTHAPKTCLNFIKLCKVKYYNNALFYDIQRDYMARCGKLDSDTSIFGYFSHRLTQGEDSRYFEDEIHPHLRHDRKGIVSMASRAPDLNGSHFFITLTSNGTEFDRKHSIFGRVEEGLEILEKINSSYCDGQGRPYKDVRIRHTYILDDPFEDPVGLQVPPASPEPVKDSDRLLDEDLIDTNADPEVLDENIKEQETKTRAIVLEMIGDLPDAEIKPPDNVAFVCRLNPATTSSDLYVIFSRFGPVKSCEVIKDWKTGESLQYAFVEFENTRDCEEAVLKMDGILIDERRIHVDFSQSVAKLWKKYRRGRAAKQIEEEGPIKIKENAHQTRYKQHRHKMVFDEDTRQKRKKRERSRERET